MPYLNQDSTIWYPCKSNNPTMVSGGVGGLIQKIDWNNNIIWEFSLSNDSLQHHHDIEPMPNGNILIIAWSRKNLHEAQSMGREIIETPLQQMWSESVFEIKPVGTDSAEIVWEWHLWDHLVQDVNPNLSNYGVISEHPELLNINLGQVGFGMSSFGSDNADWIHFNSIDYNPYLDQIVLSSRMMNEIYIIDHSTTSEEAASHSGGNSGKGGDFLYRWGNPQNYGRGNNSDHWLGDQHSINWIDEGSPGQGNLICYVNRFTDSYAAVLEFIPPLMDDGNYYIEDGQPYGPSSYEWLKQASSNFNFTTSMQGGAFRLPNGNTIITDCDSADIYEIDSNGNLEDSFSESGGNIMIARAEKYNPDYFNFVAGIPGDVNGDEIINILDVVQTINIILGTQESTSLADLNNDDIVNILDVVQLINIVLST